LSGRLVLLGIKGGPAVRPGGPMPVSSLLEIGGRRAVVDCGLGVTRALTNAGMHLRTLELIFVTHLHSDHVLELGGLVHTAWTAGLSSLVRVFGPVGTSALWNHFMKSMEFDIRTRIDDEGRPDLRSLVAVDEFGAGEICRVGELTVSALRVEHPPVAECYALRFEGGGSVVFSADTAFFPPLAAFAAGADILVHEAMLEKGIDRLVTRTANGARLRQHLLASHTLAADAGRIAAEAGVKRLVLNHLIPADDPEIGEGDWVSAVRKSWQGALTIGRDGLVVPIQAASRQEEMRETGNAEERDA
jgi:ribonuclease BN (tRNA processing enzyme)